MLLNGSALNATGLNGSAASSGEGDYDWEALAPTERQVVYQATVGEVAVPVSSFQSTMRLTGQSFVQMVVPDGDAYIDALAPAAGATMTVAKGYRYADDSLSPLEPIAQAPFQQLRSDDGANGMTLTLSGYGLFESAGLRVRPLRGVTYRSVNQGNRRVRCEIDLFLRPGDTAVDSDGAQFSVATIQYFVGAASDFMEVMQDG